MTSQEVQFRSKRERERDVHLEKNYRQIGISAIAAASHALSRTKAAAASAQTSQQQFAQSDFSQVPAK